VNFLDIFIIVLLAWGTYKGFKNGLVIELFTLFALFLGLYAAIHFSDYVAEKFMGEVADEDSYIPVVAFILTFLAVGAMVYFGGKAFEKVIKVVQLSLVNKMAGALFGLIKYVFIAGTIILISESMDSRSDFIDEDTKSSSLFYGATKKVVTFCIPAFDESKLLIVNALSESETNE
jgi:membrane protein required for colicin V production